MRKPQQFQNHFASFNEALSYAMFRAFCSNVVDGDTADFFVDLGWYNYSYLPIRISGIDTPETRGTKGRERKLAEKAKKRTSELILGKPVLVRTKKRISFGRFSGDILILLPETYLNTKLKTFEIVKEDNSKLSLISLADILDFEELTVKHL